MAQLLAEARAETGLRIVTEAMDVEVFLEVLRALRRHRLEEDTIVVFTSDNGPWLSYGHHAGSKGLLREGKGTEFEGGVRVPFVARWPGRIPAGITTKSDSQKAR